MVKSSESSPRSQVFSYQVRDYHGPGAPTSQEQRHFRRWVTKVLDDPQGWRRFGLTFIQFSPGNGGQHVIFTLAPGQFISTAFGFSGLSCYYRADRNVGTPGEIFIHLGNWCTGAQSGLSVANYRRYVLNHEMGHALGLDHPEGANPEQRCHPDGTARIMNQMTWGPRPINLVLVLAIVPEPKVTTSGSVIPRNLREFLGYSISQPKTMLHTLRGLEKWYEHSVTHLGWMVIAHSRAKDAREIRKTAEAKALEDKIRVYISGLHGLETAIQERLRSITDANHRSDLETLAVDVDTLLHETNRILAIRK